jgi:glucosylceramidase
MRMFFLVFHRVNCRRAVVSLGLVISLGNCSPDEGTPNPGPPKQPEEIGKAQVWLTTGDQSKLLSHESDISITEIETSTLPSVTIDVTQKLQEIEGFGAALTGSSAYLIHQKLSSGQRSQLLSDLFDPATGIGISYLRMTIGASDFSLSDYTYNDMPSGETDFALNHFTIQKDQEDVVPVFKDILAVAPGIKIMGSPWSPPAWMKTNGNLRGGKLKPEAYETYAQYFVKYITAYKNEGIPIDAITPQNEPLYSTASYPCLDMSSAEQLTFIKNNLGPALATANLQTKIIAYDHNFDNTSYAISIMNDPVTKNFVAGSAFHAYGGNVSAMSTVHNAHPDKGLYFTEISGGRWATSFSDNLQWYMANIFIGTTKNWSKTALLWNLALNESDGPTNNGCADCRGVVTINSATGLATKNVEYYAIGHFSKFVRSGAYRIVSTEFDGVTHLDQVAFLNTDGSKVVVVANNDVGARTFTLKTSSEQIKYTLPGKSVVSIRWY